MHHREARHICHRQRACRILAHLQTNLWVQSIRDSLGRILRKVISKKILLMKDKFQIVVHMIAGADPGLGRQLLFGLIFLKTAWKRQKADRDVGVRKKFIT